MQTNKTENIETIVAGIDLSPIKVKLMDPESGEGWSREYADHVELWYRRFLVLTFKYPKKAIVVNEAIDTFWHHHILDTRKYAEDCNLMFGHFLHHFPYFGMRGEADTKNLQECFSETLNLIESEFGESLEVAFGSRWEQDNRPTRTEQPRFKGSTCSDCGGRIAFSNEPEGEHVYFRDRPTLVS